MKWFESYNSSDVLKFIMGNQDYAKYDNWFVNGITLKDFYENSCNYSNRQVASTLKEAWNSGNENLFKESLTEYADKIKEY